jgi:hypothetical protein
MLDGDGYAELLARRPVLYHRVWDSDEATDASVLEHGLERVASGYTGFWESRCGHVFLKASPETPEASFPHMRPPNARPWTLFAVATAHLERRRFEPDEDSFLTQNFLAAKTAKVSIRECQRHRVPFPPSVYLWEMGSWLGCGCPTLAEWADAVGLGSDPQATRETIMADSTLSYSGIVPASALRLVSRGHGKPPKPWVGRP